MQIVINISEYQYSKIKRKADTQHYRCYLTPEQLIANGTVLPENHGRLIDTDEALSLYKDKDQLLKELILKWTFDRVSTILEPTGGRHH